MLRTLYMGRLLAVASMAIMVTLPAATQSPVPGPEPPAKPFDQAAALAQLRASIAGREEMPAVEVFKNVKQYKNATAARFLRIMEFGLR